MISKANGSIRSSESQGVATENKSKGDSKKSQPKKRLSREEMAKKEEGYE